MTTMTRAETDAWNAIVQSDYLVPNIETVVEINGALRDAEGMIEGLRVLLENREDG